MKQKLQRLCRIANTAMSAVPSLAGRVRVGLLIAIMMPVGAWAQNSTPTYIASIGVAQDGSSGSTGVNDCKSELSGHVIIDRDLNDGAGGDYVYMGYKTTTDPSKAITGIVFRVGKNPPHSITYQGYTFNLVGGDYEANTASLGGWIDLNGRANGVYIYTYVTRASGYGAPLTSMIVNGSSSHSGYITATNTSGNVINLNQEAGGDYLCLHYQRFSATVKSTFHYLTSSGTRTSSTLSKNVSNHLTALTSVPSVASSVTYGGRTFTFRGWREDNTAAAPTVTSPSATYITGNKVYRAVYSTNVTLSYDANGGSGAPAAQTATQYLNAGSSSVSQGNARFTVPSTKPVYATKCFLGWSVDASSTTASYKSGSTVSVSGNTTLYAVFSEHEYAGNQCSVCGHSVTYIDRVWNSTTKQLDESVKTAPANIVEVTSATTAMSSGWYLAKGTVNITEPITVSGTVHLILTDGASLTSVQCTVNEGNAIYIYAQSSGANMGSWKLSKPGRDIDATLGGEAGKNAGKIVINGGAVSATAGGEDFVAAIGGGRGGSASEIIINGGAVSALSYGRGAAIGGGYEGAAGEITINGGSVTAKAMSGEDHAAGIGGGDRGDGGSIAINGGTIQAFSDSGYGIGRGYSGTSGSVTINGGNISVSSVDNGPTISDPVKNSAGDNVSRVIITLSGASDGDAVTKVAGITYGLNDVETLHTTLNFYLPSGASSNITAITAGGKEYICRNRSTFYTSHDWSKKDGICAHGCGAACVHENQTGSTCEICGLQIGGFDENGFSIIGNDYEPAELNAGYYQIKNGGNLFWFANYVNTVDRTANAVLTADIDLEERAWTPIGSTGENSNNYRGHFDGQGHTITGLKVEGGRAGLGFFGEVRTGTVENFTIYGDVVASTDVNYVGGVIGSACGLNSDNDLERNGATIRNITSYVNLTAGSHGIGMVGGFIGYANHETLIENCAWYGTFDAGKYRVDSGAGGLLGRVYDNSAVTIRNCAAYGTIRSAYRSGTYNNQATIYIGGIVSYSSAGAQTVIENTLWAGTMDNKTDLGANAHISAIGTLSSFRSVTHCYALEGSAPYVTTNGTHDTHITTVTAGQLASGEVAYKLGDAWGQAIGTDPYPVLGGAKVYHGYLDCTAAVYTNNAGASDEKVHNHVDGFCTVCGLIDAGGGVTIRDGGHTSFAVAEDTEVASITYERTLPNQKWNPLYVPFDIPVSLLAEGYDVARISRVYTATDAGGTVDNMEIETIAEGTLEANTPYFIRAKSEAARTMNLTVADATLKATATAGVAYTSDAAAYTLVPVYTAMTRTDMVTDIRVITADGVWARMREGSTLNPFRFYLTITPKSSASATPVTVRIITRGEGAGTTGIENPEPETRHSGLIYNLKGQPVEHPVKGQIYIQGGRKVVWGE